jgi:hypothetical protein
MDKPCLEAQNNDTKALIATNISQMSTWNRYPAYSVYDSMMRNFANNYPHLCILDTIGYTTNNKLLLAVKISNNVNQTNNKPKFFYSSSMHGDELTGAIMLLRLADYLLSNYSDTQIANIINNVEVYICPFANPDGTYLPNDNDISAAQRYNARNYDLNRDFPATSSNNPNNLTLVEAETKAFILYAKAQRFDINANLHGGAEVCNYPFDDILPSGIESHADNQWFIETCQRFVDTLRHYDNSYFTYPYSSGYVLGADWYKISGSRQDYHTYFLRQREITLEVSTTKTPAASTLPSYWNKLYPSLLCLLEECLKGVNGVVTDCYTGEALDSVFIHINGHDRDNSEVFSKENGYFFRPLHNGTYNFTFSKYGYITKNVEITLSSDNIFHSDICLEPVSSLNETYKQINDLRIYPNPVSNYLNIKNIPNGHLIINDIMGRKMLQVQINNNETTIDVSHFANGIYTIKLISKDNQVISNNKFIKQ